MIQIGKGNCQHMHTRLIALDMDGTLLNRSGQISKENKVAILEAMEKGIKVVIATGRSFKDAKRVLDQAELVLPIIGVNGASITLENGQNVSSIPLSTDIVAQLITYFRDNQVYFEVYTNVDTYTSSDEHQCIVREIDELGSSQINIPKEHLEHLVDQQKQQARVVYLDQYDSLLADPNIEIYKLLTFTFYQQKLHSMREYLRSNPNLAVSASANYNIEITNNQAQKGNGLKILADYYNIPLEATMAIGDNYNDISMFEVAGISVAMGNADTDIKKVCTMTTLTNDEHGVAHAIQAIL
jgi:Cof subfamily protein (haloacid dehalogenase superfamily)